MDNDNRDTDDTITQGMQAHWGGGAIGGVNAYLDDDGIPTVTLAAMPEGGGFTDHDLHEGDTFELGPELWEVTEIKDPGTPVWAAEITRLR